MMLFFCAGAMWVLRIMEGKVWPGFHQGADRSKDDDAQADGIAKVLKVLVPDKKATMEAQM